MIRRSLANRPLRRMVLVVLWLAAVDQMVEPVLRSLERERYEAGAVFRFENSDLFGLGPLVQYLREHPSGERPRTVFFGNSIMWGYGLQAGMTLPAHFQRLEPQSKVFNIAINGFDTGNSFLIARALIDSIDRLYVLRVHDRADARLPSLIPIDDSDLRQFALARPDTIERTLQRRMGWWRLYYYTYRLQMAALGTSTRQYIYLHKGELARGLVARIRAAGVPAPLGPGAITITRPVHPGPVPPGVQQAVARNQWLVWRFGELARDHGKRLVLLHIARYSDAMSEEEMGVFNRSFAPHAEIVMLRIPRELTHDGQHLSDEGSRALAMALHDHEQSGHAR